MLVSNWWSTCSLSTVQTLLRSRRGAALLLAPPLLFTSAPAALAQSFTDFEPSGFVPGESVDNHRPDGTEASPEISFGNNCVQAWFVPREGTATEQDEEIVDLTGNKVWRFSQGGTDQSLGANPHSARFDGVAGETGAANDAGCGAPTTDSFYAEVMFTSATGAAQPNLQIDLSANSGDTRHAFSRIFDDGTGSFDLTFVDTVDGCQFNFTTIDADLDPSLWHRLGIEMQFADGLASGVAGSAGAFGNDVVNIYLDGFLVHTGTSWESCVGARSVDRLLFDYNTQDPAQSGFGLYFDEVLVTEVCPEGNCAPPPPEFESVGQCVSTLIGENCQGLTGRERAECNHEQQMTCFDLFGVK